MELTFFTSIHAQLGIMTWPFTLLSGVLLMLIVERSLFTLLNANTRSEQLRKEIYRLSLQDDVDIEKYLLSHQTKPNTLSQGLCMLIRHRKFTKALREEAVSIWLQKIRRQYISGLKVLTIIGTLSPLIGLLGTVLGLIEMFKGLSQSQGISPADLADGLGLAMSTTAVGLVIALPAIAAAQLFTLWADSTLAHIEHVLNHFNLYLSGMASCDSNTYCVNTCPTDCANQRPPLMDNIR